MPGAAPDLQELQVTVHIRSPDSEEMVQRVYQAWLERCPVYLALTKTMAVRAELARAA